MENRKQLTELLFLYETKGIGLEQLLDKIELLYTKNDLGSLEDRRNAFIEEVRPFVEQYGKDMVNKFCNHFLQITPNGRKFLFEKQKAWNLKLRLANWKRNDTKWSIVGMLNKNK